MLKVYNTLSKRKEMFIPIKGKNVGMYSCGPTVYNYVHIGNLRAYVISDVIKKYLKFAGYKVKHVTNLTDVDDKTIKKSIEEGKSLKEVTTKYANAFFDDMKLIGIEPADIYPRATEHIKEITTLVNTLLKKGYAYLSNDGSIYFDISKFKNYGKLSNIKIETLKEGASERIKKDEYQKENANDFALWKAWSGEDGSVFWNAEFMINGEKKTIKGRPGWHIECSAMSMKYLGESFDIHAGGQDLIFPHHENEIAQSEAATEKTFVKYWLHNGWLLVEGKKMSKSLGNFYTLRDLIAKGYSAKVIRMALITNHYREPFDLTDKKLESVKSSLSRIHEFVRKLKNYTEDEENELTREGIEKLKKDFRDAMNDDFDTAKALIVIFDFIRDFNSSIDAKLISNKTSKEILKVLEEIDYVLGFIMPDEIEIPKEISSLVKEREKARKEKNWKRSDEVREEIKKKGYQVDDTSSGQIVRKL